MQLVDILKIKSYEKIKEFLNDEHVGRISSIDVNGFPQIIPMNFVFLNDAVYIHSHVKGEKLDNISKNNKNIKFGPFLFNQNSLNLYKDGISVHLTTSEQKLLNCFALSPNKALSRDDINNLLGGNMEIRSIDVAIVRIRRKLEQDQRYPIYLQTVRGVGWMLQTHEDKINYD